jgi:hypothetical protein
MAKGRKRKSGERFPSGDLRQVKDHGTAELQYRRAHLAGKGDPTLTTHPLGILFARNAIDLDQRNAGERYARLYASVIGRPTAAAVTYTGEQGGAPEIDPKRENHTQASLDEAQRVLKSISRKAKTLVDNVAIYDRCPAWAVKAMPSESEYREKALLLEALNHLAVAFGYTQRRRAA